MGIIGNLNKNGDYVSKHMDKRDLIPALFHVTGSTSKSFGYRERKYHVSMDD